MNKIKNKLKIWILIGGLYPAIVGGKEKQAFYIATHLSKNYEVTILTRYKKNNITKNIPYKLIQIKYFNIPLIRYFCILLKSILKISKYKNKIDLLLCWGTGDDTIKGLICKKLFKIPFIISIAGENSYKNISVIKRKLLRILISECKYVRVLTKKMKKDLIYFFPNEKTVIIPIGINFSKIIYRNLNERKNQIIFVGRLSSNKGINYLIKAMNKLNYYNCTIIGDGPEKNILKSLAKRKNIRFLGNIENNKVYSYLSDSKILVLPSFTEGFPNAILEAMSVGTPIITTKVGGIPDVIIHGKTGYLVKQKNSDEIAFYINKLLSNKKLWEKMSRNCLKEAQKYSWNKIIFKFEKIFKKIIMNKNDK